MTPKKNDVKVESWLEDEGVEFELNSEFPLKKIDFDSSLKNQARLKISLYEDIVERYAELMEAGTPFPPAVGYMKNNKLIFIDGNHRGQANLLMDNSTMPVYVVKGANASKIIALTFTANTSHGLPNKEEERVEHALHMVREGVTQAYAANMMGLKTAEVQGAWRRAEADRRAAAVGINKNQWNAIAAPSRVRVSSISNDLVMKKAVSVITKLNMKATEISLLISDIKKQRTDAERTKMLNAILKERSSEVGVVTRGSKSTQSRRYLLLTHGKGLVKDLHLDDFYSDLHPEEASEYVKVLKDVVRECNKALKELQAYA